MKRCLLDSSFLVFNEYPNGRVGPAVTWLQKNPRTEL